MSASPCIGTRKDLLDFNESQRANQALDEYLGALERHWHGKTLASIADAAQEAHSRWCAAGRPGGSARVASELAARVAIRHIQTSNSIVIERFQPRSLK